MRGVLENFIQKLVHPLTEVRIRSANALQQKLELGVCGIKDLLQNSTFLMNVISLLQSDSTVLKMHGINLLHFILQDPQGALNFEVCGGKQILYELRSSIPAHQEKKIDILLEKLNSKSKRPVNEMEFKLYQDMSNNIDNSFSNHFSASYVNSNSQEEPMTSNSFVDDSCVSEKDLLYDVSSPILFTSFPWVPLTSMDLRVLTSAGQALVDVGDTDVMVMLQVCQSTLFKDFPIEIFLQRPFILKVLLSLLLADPNQVGDSWRLQEKVCTTLCAFSRHLISRLINNENKVKTISTLADESNDVLSSGCCSESSSHKSPSNSESSSPIEIASVETLHESEDSNEFIVLKVYRLTVIDWCCELIIPAFELLKKSQPRLSSALLRLTSLTMRILRECLCPGALWHFMTNSAEATDERNLLHKISSTLLQSLNILSSALLQAYEESKIPAPQSDLEVTWIKIRNLTRILIYWINLFSPSSEFDMVFDRLEIEAFQHLLSDVYFYLEYPEDYAMILSLVRRMEEEIASQADALIDAKERLENTKFLLQISSSEVDEFLDKASSSLPLLFLHQSRVLVEKVVRGLAKQVASSIVSPLQISRGRSLLLQLLSDPDDDSRILGYNALKNLVTESIGISQASQTSRSRSPKILFLLHSRILNHLIYSGCTDTDARVVEATRLILLTLIRGHHLMTEEVLQTATDCFSDCLLNLQNIAETETCLGRAILSLPYDLAHRRDDQYMHLLRLQFFLKCLLSRDSKVRQDCFRNCLALLITATPSEFVSVPSSEIDMRGDANLLIFNYSVEALSSCPTDALNRSALKKVLSVISRPSLADLSVMGAAWTQLTFLLRNPALHSGLEALWPLSELVLLFSSMMKVSGERGLTVALVPSALETLRLRASFSAEVRSAVATDSQLLLLILRAALFFRKNDAVRLEASLLFALVLNEEVLLQVKSGDSGFCSGSFSVPTLVSSSQHIVFTHRNYPWPTEVPSNPRMRTLRAMATRGEEGISPLLPVPPLHFLRLLWATICSDDWKEFVKSDVHLATALSSRLVLTEEDVIALQTRLILPNAAGLIIGAQNATSHRSVKRCANFLQALLVAIDDNEGKVDRVLRLEGWTEAFARFFLTFPASALDKQVLYHIMTLIGDILDLVAKRSNTADCVFCSMICLLAAEFSKPESSLTISLKEAGTEHLTPATQEALQSAQLLESLLRVISLLFRLSNQWKCKCRLSPLPWHSLAANISFVFTLILRKCKTLQDYNLNALVPTLECFVFVVDNQNIAASSILQLIPLLIDLLMCFHTGRGRAHNAFLGRAVSVRALLVMAFLICGSDSDVLEILNVVREEVPSLPWLLSALEHSDPALMTAGLKVAITLSMTAVGARILDESFDQIPGGIWSFVFRYFVKPGIGALVRESCAHLLMNWSSLVVNLPEEEKPWLSLSLNDTITGVTVAKEDALIEVLKLFGVVKRVRQMIKTVRPLPEGGQSVLPPDIEMKEEMKQFVSSESEWATLEEFDDDDGTEIDSVEDFPELVAASLFLLVNLMRLTPDRMREIVLSNGVGKALLRQLGSLTEEVKVSNKWNEVLESGFTLLEAIGKPFSSNTHLAALALNILSSEFTVERISLRQMCFRFLSRALCEGGWGSVRVLELLRDKRLPVLSSLIKVLHEGSPTQIRASGLTFVGALCKAADRVTPEVYIMSLRNLLDSPIQLHNLEKTVCPGWEISRHLIQLLPSNMDPALSRCYSAKVNEHEGNLKLLLEALKLLFLVSSSARQCAYFQPNPLLKLLSFSLSNLQAVILKLNIHITSNLMNKKELTADFLFATHSLQVATNWIVDAAEAASTEIEVEDEKSFCPSTIGECLIPELHPLWVSALRAAPFADALIQFLISASSHTEVCSILTRTSLLPGALLSNSRTRNSLLVSITTSVGRLLERRKVQGGRCENGCADLPKTLLEDSLDLLINCGRVHSTAYVIVKEGFLKTAIKFLEHSRDLNTPVVQKLIQCLTILTLHKEARAALLKISPWVKCLKICLKENSLRKNVLLVFTNMIANLQAVKNMLSTEDFLSPMVSILIEASQDLTKGTERQVDAQVHICIVVLWCLAANNQRCKAILKRLSLLPHLENLFQHRRHPQLCLRLIKIINS